MEYWHYADPSYAINQALILFAHECLDDEERAEAIREVVTVLREEAKKPGARYPDHTPDGAASLVEERFLT